MKYTPLLTLVFMTACSQAPQATFAGFEQMEGNWVCRQANGQVFFESWKTTGDRMYGQGFLVQDSDTLFGEKLVVEQVHGQLVYIAFVQGQNPALFTRQQAGDKAFRFENKEHDFPQVILYEPGAGNTLRVVVTGKENDSTVSEEMIFKRQEP